MSHSPAPNGRLKNISSRTTAQIASQVAARDGLPRLQDDTTTPESVVSPLCQLNPAVYVSLPGNPAALATVASSQDNNTRAQDGVDAPTPATYDQHQPAKQSLPCELLLPKAGNAPCDSPPHTQPFAPRDGSDSSPTPANTRTEGWRIPPGGVGSPVVAASISSSSSTPSLPSLLSKNSPPAAPDLQMCPINSSPMGSLPPIRRNSKVSWQPDNMLPTQVSARETHTTRSKETETRTVSIVDGHRATLFAYVAMALIVIVFCVVLIIALLVTVPPDRLQTVCRSTACAKLEALLEDSVDRTKDACSDFYAYVCHGWAHYQNVSVYRSHVQRFLADVDRILRSVTVPVPGESKADQAVAALYRTCMNVLAGEAEELPAFRDHLQRIGVSWPNVSPKPNVVLAAVRVYAHFGVTAVMRVRRLVITGGRDTLEVAPDEGFLGEWKKTRDRLLSHGVYKRLFEETTNIYSGSNNRPAQEVLRYEQFVEIENEVLTGVALEKLSGNVTLVVSVDSLAAVTKNIEITSWRAAAKTLKLSSEAQVQVIDLDYVKRVDEVLNTVGAQHFHYYMGWCVVQLMRRYMDKALAKSWYDYEDTSSPVVYESDKQRTQADCVQLVESLVGLLTFRRFLLWTGDSIQDELSSMSAMISEQLKEKVMQKQINGRIDHYPRASDFNVDHSEDTLKVLDEAFGSEWHLSNLSSLFSNWMDVARAASTINATFRNLISTTYVKDFVANEQYNLFDDRKGTVFIPPMYLMLPVYDQRVSEAAKFGALGTLLATASLRVFLARLTAEPRAHDAALRKLGCFAKAAGHGRDKLQLFHLAASAAVALDGLRYLPKKDRLRLQMFSKVQTFFVLMCYLMCTPHASDNAEYAQVMCNEAVKNDAHFSGAFECPPDSPMNPARKCNFF